MFTFTGLLSATVLLAASLARAAPNSPAYGSGFPSNWSPSNQQLCLTPSTAQYLVDGYSGLLTAYTTPNANLYLAPNFVDYSDSINFLISAPLGGATFANREAFIQGQGTQPAIGFTVLNIDAVTCNVIAFRWEAMLGSGSPVKGINIMVAANNGGTWQIETNYSEFNSATWDIEVGGTCTPPKQ